MRTAAGRSSNNFMLRPLDPDVIVLLDRAQLLPSQKALAIERFTFEEIDIGTLVLDDLTNAEWASLGIPIGPKTKIRVEARRWLNRQTTTRNAPLP